MRWIPCSAAERSIVCFLEPLKTVELLFANEKPFSALKLFFEVMVKTILLIDDDDFILFGLSRAIGAWGRAAEVLTAHHGKEAVNILSSRAVDVVVTDLKMPVMNGYELVEYVNSHFPLLPVYVMTGDYLPDVKPRFRASSVAQFVSKPFSFKQLAADIMKTIEPANQAALA
jgi:CheY-like chemotaxis protein